MFDKILSFVADVVSPITKVIDEVHTSDEERLELKKAIIKLESQTLMKLNELTLELAKAQAAIIMAEVKDGNWLTKAWRPIAMLCFLMLVMLDTFGLIPQPLNENVWLFLQIGLGGYVIGRSAERVASHLTHK